MSAELEALAGVTATADANAAAATPPDPNAPPPPPVIDFSAEAAQAVDMFSALVIGYAPAAAEIWGNDAKLRVALTLAPVLQKYGVSVGSMPPELMLLITAGPLLYQSSKAVAAQMQAERAKSAKDPKKADAPAGSPAPAAAPDSPPQLVHPQVALYT